MKNRAKGGQVDLKKKKKSSGWGRGSGGGGTKRGDVEGQKIEREE